MLEILKYMTQGIKIAKPTKEGKYCHLNDEKPYTIPPLGLTRNDFFYNESLYEKFINKCKKRVDAIEGINSMKINIMKLTGKLKREFEEWVVKLKTIPN